MRNKAIKFSTAIVASGLLLAGTAHAMDMGNMMNPSKWMGGNKNSDRYDDYGGPGGYGGGPGGYGGGPGGYGGGPGYGGSRLGGGPGGTAVLPDTAVVMAVLPDTVVVLVVPATAVLPAILPRQAAPLPMQRKSNS